MAAGRASARQGAGAENVARVNEQVMRDALNVTGEVPIYVVDGLGYIEDT